MRTSVGAPRSCSTSVRRCSARDSSLDSLQAFRQAAEIARDLGEGELLARAAIGFETACWRPGLTDEGARELLEEASAALGREDSTLRVGLLASLARALEFEGNSDRAALAREDAIAMARRIDDRPGLATVLMGIYWARATTSLAEALEMLGEARELAEELGDVEGQAEATQWRVSALMALGEIVPAREELAIALDMAKSTRQPFMLHVTEHYRSGAGAARGSPRRGRGGRGGARASGVNCSSVATPRASTASRCSESGASRAASPSSPR